MKPKIGITWGSTANPEYMAKLALYAKRVRSSGGEPTVIMPLLAIGDAVEYLTRNDAGFFLLHAGEGAKATDFDGVLFAGGDDVDPVRYGETHDSDALDIDAIRDAFEFSLITGALDAGVPFLGICRGMQVMNVALGGALYQDIPTQHESALEHRRGTSHLISIVKGSRLAALAGATQMVVNSWHHQGVKLPGGLAPGLVATAHSTDGMIEACEPEPGRFPGYVMAVQWHPERPDPSDAPDAIALTEALLADFMAACEARSRMAKGSGSTA